MQEMEGIPGHLAPVVHAAVLWVNDTRGSNFELTGLVDVDDIDSVKQQFEMGLVLCDGEICAREQISVVPNGDIYQFSFINEAAPDIPPLLDPPAGLRSNWLDEQLEKYEFVLLLYYRGLW